MADFITAETLIIELLLIVSVVAIIVRRLRIPYTVALVLVGLLITFQQGLEIELTPELILSLFVPPLVFEAAFHIEWKHLRESVMPILALAVPGVVLTTFLVGGLVSYGANLPLTTALVFGALIAATDPVAVVALFRALGVTKRLAVLVEGESLFNDGTAIVVFNLMLAAALTVAGTEVSVATTLTHAVIDFIRESAGGLAVGIGLGWIITKIIARVDDYLIETTLTTVLAFGSYLLADRIHVSGVLAVVAAGIVCGNIGPQGMSPTTKIVVFNFWEYLAFITNSMVFLLIGLDVNIVQIVDNIVPIIVAVVAVLASRALVIYGLTWLVGLRWYKVQTAYRHVMFWGGLRGAISLALVLSVPATFADRELLSVMTFGVVLFTLLIQGTTMQVLLRRLGLTKRDEMELEYERRQGRLMAARAARDRVHKLYRDGLISGATWEILSPEFDHKVQNELESQRELLRLVPTLQAQEREDARHEGLRAARAMLVTLQSNGVLSEIVYEELVTDVDAQLGEDTDLVDFTTELQPT